MEVIKVKISDLVFDPNNARKHNPKNIDAIKGSLTKFGQQKPIVIDSKNVVIAGNGTLQAAKELGWKEITAVVTTLDDFNKMAFALADNRTSELAEWDIGNLNQQLAQLDLGDFDLKGIGFEDGDFSLDDEKKGNEGLTDPDDVPEVEQNVFGVKRGDIWQLGNHRIMCGDSTSEDDVKKLMDGKKADITFTSPPYNAGSMEIKGNDSTKKKYNSFDDNKSEEEYEDFLSKNLKILMSFSEEVFYNIGLVEKNKRVIIDIQYKFKDKFKDIIYWKKSSVAPHIQTGVINNLVEFIICFGDGKRKFKNHQFSQGSYWNVIEGSNASSNDYSKIHKATFPIYLPENILNNFCPKNGSVIDSFCGTGTTIIACEKTGRICYGMELDEHYCSVIIKRWEDFTGLKAERLSNA